MKTQHLVAIAVLAVSLLAGFPRAAAQLPGDGSAGKNPVERYAEGVAKEEMGAVDLAIALFREVRMHAQAPPSLQARALYREGLCQVRSNNLAAARAAFEHLLEAYPNEEPSAHAGLMLKALGASRTGVASARDISDEVRDQLIQSTKSAQSAQSALKTLTIYGSAAWPALRNALRTWDPAVQLLALNALAATGDLKVLDRLIEVAGTKSFRSRVAPVYLSREGALRSLCEANQSAIPRVAAAYREAEPGRGKANLMRILVGVQRADQVADYKDHLQSDDAEMRAAAWYAYHSSAFDGDGDPRAFFADLLLAWNVHPGRQAELTDYLFKFASGRQAVQRDPALAGPLQKVLLAAASSEDPAIVRQVAQRLQPLDLAHQLPIRTALLAASDPKVRARAAALPWAPSDPRPELDRAQLDTFVNTLIDTAVAHRAREENHSIELMRALVQNVVPLLEPGAYAMLVDRVFTPPLAATLQVDAPFDRGVPLAREAQRILAVSGVQGAYTNRDRFFPLAEKYVPVLLAYAASDKPLAARAPCFRGLGEIVQRAWTYLAAAQRESIKQAYFGALDECRTGRVPAEFSRELRGSLQSGLHTLVRKHPRVLTVDEVLEHDLLGGEKNVAGSGIVHTRSILLAFSPQELRDGFLRGVRDEKARVAPLLGLLAHTEIDADRRDQALRELWARAGAAERAGIVAKLAKSGPNLTFLTERIQPGVDEAVARAIHRTLDGWGSREATEGLIKLLEARSDSLKIRACASLGSLADPRAVPRLIELLAYHDRDVRKAAQSALTAIRDIGKSQAEWREWHERQGKNEKPGGDAPGKAGEEE